VILIEAPAAAEEVARRLARTLPQIDAALDRAEAGPQTARTRRPEITIRLPDSEAATDAWTDCDDGACAVEFFPGFWQGADGEKLAFTRAPEMLHVAQILACLEVDHCNAWWWVKGTAEWFANRAMPGQEFTARAGYLAHWDATSAGTRLIDMEYEALAFWFWAGERLGPVPPLTIGDFGNPGLNRGQAVSRPLSPDDWVDFASVYLLGAQPDRAALPCQRPLGRGGDGRGRGGRGAGPFAAPGAGGAWPGAVDGHGRQRIARGGGAGRQRNRRGAGAGGTGRVGQPVLRLWRGRDSAAGRGGGARVPARGRPSEWRRPRRAVGRASTGPGRWPYRATRRTTGATWR
jgi:hypothetical protein